MSLRVCFVGPMLARHPGRIPTQGERLADLLAHRGHQVLRVSDRVNPLARAVDTVSTLISRRKDYDTAIVTAYSGRSFAITEAASTVARLLGKHVVISLHGGGLPDLMARQPRRVRRVLSPADSLVSQSEFLARATSRFGLRATIIPNALDGGPYAYRHRASVRPRLFWMRSFHQVYNPQLAIRVLALLRGRYPEATLCMGGPDKGLLAECQQLARTLGVAEAVHFPGFLDMAGKQREADRADIFINTNRVDNRPLALVEAAAMGLVIVATQVGGLADLVTHEQTALLVPDDDAPAMAAAVERLVEGDELASRLSQAGLELARASAPERVAEAWESLLGDLTAGKP